MQVTPVDQSEILSTGGNTAPQSEPSVTPQESAGTNVPGINAAFRSELDPAAGRPFGG